MTGSPIGLRRYGGCNLHAYPPFKRITRRKRTRLYDPPSRLDRQKIYIPEEHARPTSRKYGRDKHGPYTWMGTDCLWEWLATRPGVRNAYPIARLFDRLHEHVHTPHRERRVNVPLEAQRAAVRLTRSTELDEKFGTEVYPAAHEYLMNVRFSGLDEDTTTLLCRTLREYDIDYSTRSRGITVTWVEQASNPTHAREVAQKRLRDANLSLGGTFWETPERITT